MIAARLVAYAPNGPRLGLLGEPSDWSASTPLNGVSALSLKYAAASQGAEHITGGPIEVALETAVAGGSWAEIPNGRFVRLVRDGDETDATGTWSFQLPGYAHFLSGIIVLPAANPSEENTDSDGKRKFLSATAGQIIHTVLAEARAYDPQVLPGLATDFTTERDSDGKPWSKILTIYYEPGLDLAAIIDNLAAQGVLDWKMQGRTLQVFNPDTVLARENTATRVYNQDSTSAPVKGTIEGLKHLVMLRGDGGRLWQRDNPSAPAPWGKTMTLINQGGVVDEGTAAALIQSHLDEGARERIEYTRAVRLDSGAPAPYTDYQVGDYITARDINGRFATLRVFQIGLALGGSGLEATLTLGDLFEDALVRQAKRQKGIVGGATADGGSGTRPAPPEPARRTPRPPAGLVMNSSHYYDQRGVSRAAVLASYDPATHGTDGIALTIQAHELHGRPVGSTEPYRLLTSVAGSEGNIGFSPLPVGEIWDFRVRAIAENGIPSGWSNTVRLELAADTTPPPPPSAPQVSTRLGTITVAWDGKTADDTAMPADFDYCEIQVAGPDAPTTEPVRFNRFIEPRPVTNSTRWRTTPPAQGETVGFGLRERPADPYPFNRFAERWWNTPHAQASGIEVESVLPDIAPAGTIPTSIYLNAASAFEDTVVTLAVSATVYNAAGLAVGERTDTVPLQATPTGGWERHRTDVVATEPWTSIVMRIIPVGAVDAFTTIQVTAASTSAGDYFDGDAPDTEDARFEWTGTPGQSESVEYGPAHEAREELRDLPGLSSAVLADIPYRTEVGIRLVAIDTSGNRSEPSETVYIATEPLVGDDILDPIIGDGAIVDVDGSKIHPGTIETGSIKVGHSNIWANLLNDPSLREAMAKPEYTFGEDADGPYLDIDIDAVLSRQPLGEAWFEKTTEGLGGILWIDMNEIIGEGNSAPIAFNIELRPATPGGALANYLVRLQALPVIGEAQRIQDRNWTRSATDPTKWDSQTTAAQEIGGPLNSLLASQSIPTPYAGVGFLFIRSGTAAPMVARVRRPRLTRGLYGTMIMPGSIRTEQIAARAITAHTIEANAITADKIDVGAVTAEKIAANSIDADRLQARAITSKHTITGATIQTSETFQRGIKLTGSGLAAYDSAGERTVFISGSSGNATISGTAQTGTSGNRVVMGPTVNFQGQPGIRLYSGGSGGRDAALFIAPAAVGGWDAYDSVLAGSEATRNSSGRADLVLKHGGNFYLRQQYGTNSGIGIETIGRELRLFGGIAAMYGNQHMLGGVRTPAIPVGGSMSYTLTPRPVGTNNGIGTPQSTAITVRPIAIISGSASGFTVYVARENSTAFSVNVLIYWSI